MKVLQRIGNKVRPVKKGDIPVGIVGIGGWGKKYLTKLAASNLFDLRAGFDINHDLLSQCAKKYHFEVAVSYSSLLRDYGIQAVFLVLPNGLHLPFGEEAAKNGVHVFLEKPLANSVTEGEKINEACTRYKVKLYVGHNFKKLKVFEMMKQLIDSDVIGKVHLFEANRSLSKGLKLGESDWRFFNEKCPGGPLLQLGVHLIDAIIYLFGDITQARTTIRYDITTTKNADLVCALVQCKSGLNGYLGTSYATEDALEFKVYGTKGILSLHHQKLEIFKNGKYRVLYNGVMNQDTLEVEFEEFHDWLRDDSYPDNDGEYSLRILRAFELIMEGANH